MCVCVTRVSRLHAWHAAGSWDVRCDALAVLQVCWGVGVCGGLGVGGHLA